jgi:fibronectin-binding autotransporter adhesin
VVLGSQTLTFTNLAGSGATSTFSGVIQGSGGLVITGGTGGSGANRILAGNNTYTGTTTIQSGGILQLGNGGTSGSVAGPITDNGTVEFNRSNTVTYAGVISGSGTVNQIGAGTLILSGANTYNGGTTVSSGTLQGTTTSLHGNVTDEANLTFNQTTTGTYAGAVVGLGTMSVTGSGDVTLTATSTYSGTTTISAGTLTVMGSLAGPVTVAGGKLNGTGTVGAVNVTSGTLAPGDAIGTLHVNGNVALGNGTTYAVEVSPTAADETIATGAVTIGSATTLAVTQDAGTYTANDYKLISAASVAGSFTAVTGDTFTGFNSTIQYSATGVDLILSAVPPPAPVTFLFGTFGQTADQVAVGDAVTAGPATGALYITLGGVVSNHTSEVPSTLAQLSGDIHASLRSAMIEDGKIIRDTVINHAIGSGDGITVWGAGFGAYGTVEGDGDAADVHHNDSGVIIGADMPVAEEINVGLGMALTGQAITVPSESAAASGSTNHVIGYANWTDAAWVASLGWDYGWGANQVTRQITAFSETDSDHQSNMLGQVFGEVGYKIHSDVVALEPYLDLANVNARTGAFSETGGIAALDGGAKAGSENYSTLGVRATLPAISIAGIGVVPDFNLGWQHAFTRFVSNQTLTFASTGESFAVAGVPLDTDAAAVQAGLDFVLAPNATLDIGYDGNVSGRVQDHAVRGDLAWRF